MNTLQKVAGNFNSPVPGANTYQTDYLIGAIVHFIIVNNVNEDGMGSTPDYTFDSMSATLTRNNVWILGDRVIIVYSKCNC